MISACSYGVHEFVRETEADGSFTLILAHEMSKGLAVHAHRCVNCDASYIEFDSMGCCPVEVQDDTTS